MKRKDNYTLGERTADDLLHLIRKQAYEVGDKLPTEMELSNLLGVSRNTVREALRMLASRNVVAIRQGSGTFISEKNGVADDPLGFTMIKDRQKLTKDLLQIRVMLEPPIAGLAAQNATKEDIIALEQALIQVELKMAQKISYAEEDTEFHVQIAKCTHNAVMISLIPVISKGVDMFAKEVREQEYQQTFRSHRKIFRAIAEQRPLDAQQEMQYHILYNNDRYWAENE